MRYIGRLMSNFLFLISGCCRDLSDGNITMDGRPLYPKGFHPSWKGRLPDNVTKDAPHILRREALGTVRYYIIDFGESSYFPDPNVRRRVRGKTAADREVPELSVIKSYDPFPVDVFTLGNVYKRNFLQVNVHLDLSAYDTEENIQHYKNVEFLQPLCEQMTRRVPSQRPTAQQAQATFSKIISSQQASALLCRLHGRDEKYMPMVLRDVHAAAQELSRRVWNVVSTGELRVIKH